MADVDRNSHTLDDQNWNRAGVTDLPNNDDSESSVEKEAMGDSIGRYEMPFQGPAVAGYFQRRIKMQAMERKEDYNLSDSSYEDDNENNGDGNSDEAKQQIQPNLLWEIHATLESPEAQLGFVCMIRHVMPNSLFLRSHMDPDSGDHVFRMLISSEYDPIQCLAQSPYPVSPTMVYPSDTPKNHCTHCLFIPLPHKLSLSFAETAIADKLYSFHGRLVEKADDYKIVIPPSCFLKYHPCTVCGIGRRTLTKWQEEDQEMICFHCRRGVHTGFYEQGESHNGGCYVFFDTFVSPICIQFIREALDGSHWGNREKHIVSARWCRES